MSPNVAFLLQDQILPRFQSAIPYAVNPVGCEDAQELIQDGTALAAKMINGAEKKGKKVTRLATGKPGQISAGNIAYYTIVKLRNGCRSTGMITGDVYGAGTQINGRTRLNSLEEVVATDEETGGEVLFHDVLADDQDDPATKATRKMDWETFMSKLSDQDQAIIQCMVEGDPLAGLARKRRINYSTLVYHTRRLANSILEFMGSDILAQVQRSPGWKDSITASRERIAVRYERCHV